MVALLIDGLRYGANPGTMKVAIGTETVRGSQKKCFEGLSKRPFRESCFET